MNPSPPVGHEPLAVDYTKTIDYTDVHVTGGVVAFPAARQSSPLPPGAPGTAALPGLPPARGASPAAAAPPTSACCNQAVVTTRWLGFNRIWRGSGEGEPGPPRGPH